MTRRALVLVFLLSVAVPASAVGIAHLRIDGAITPATSSYLERAFAQAERDGDSWILIELDTPGGLETSMRQIVELELSSSLPVVVYVGPAGARAASAGTFLTLAADVAAMAPGTNLGAAHPVSLFGGDETSANKAASDAAAFARALAERRGRDPQWAESAVLSSDSLSASEAFQRGIIDVLADDLTALLAQLDGRALPDGRILRTAGIPLVAIEPTARERALAFLSDPNLVYILFIVGLLSLVFEALHPGIGFGLVAGGICLLLALFGLQILPVNVTGVLLILFGLGLVILDAFTPTNGLLTAGGIAAFVLGSTALFDLPDRRFGLSWGTITAVASVTAAFSLFVASKGILAQRRRPATGRDALVGALGTAREPLTPRGTVYVKGEYWTAESLDGDRPIGARVRVARTEGSMIYVREAESGEDAAKEDPLDRRDGPAGTGGTR